ncbi:hypothetical protein WMY93_032513 [Mugilogobius chulae]|uniref:Uncharacterized protein n=1 Tax=Mugilogobius chulae TaxID=88201 RepID=A0AAW0ML46_9GOBI
MTRDRYRTDLHGTPLKRNQHSREKQLAPIAFDTPPANPQSISRNINPQLGTYTTYLHSNLSLPSVDTPMRSSHSYVHKAPRPSTYH